jgi:hypothetical protein
VTDNRSTEPVSAADLQVGDIIEWPDGRYYAVDTFPEPGHAEEYSEPRIAVWVTQMNDDLIRMASSTREILFPEAEMNVLTPRPERA